MLELSTHTFKVSSVLGDLDDDHVQSNKLIYQPVLPYKTPTHVVGGRFDASAAVPHNDIQN